MSDPNDPREVPQPSSDPEPDGDAVSGEGAREKPAGEDFRREAHPRRRRPFDDRARRGDGPRLRPDQRPGNVGRPPHGRPARSPDFRPDKRRQEQPLPRTARELAAQVLLGVFSGPVEDAAEAVHQGAARARLSDADHRLAFQLTHLVLRHSTFLDQMYYRFFNETPERLRLESRVILRLATAQKALLDRIPDHAIGDESVRLARDFFRLHKGEQSFINAIVRKIVAYENYGADLRDLDRPHDKFEDRGLAPLAEAVRRSSCPPWIVEILANCLGPGLWGELPRVINGEAPVVLRANRLRSGPRQLIAELAAEGIAAAPGVLAPDSVQLAEPGDLPRALQTPAFREGHFYVQDEASQLVAVLARPQPGEKALDLCAAPGGKATHLAEILGGAGRVVATDYSPQRLDVLRENVGRLKPPGLEVSAWGQLVERGSKPATGSGSRNHRPGVGGMEERPVGPDHAAPAHRAAYCLVLLDAPCSALGTLRRHPEIRHRLKPDDLKRLARNQARLLRLAAEFVAPGGRLVYSTCTINPAENIRVIEKFLGSTLGWSVEPHADDLPKALRRLRNSDGFYRTWPSHLDLDGFEMVVLRRNKGPVPGAGLRRLQASAPAPAPATGLAGTGSVPVAPPPTVDVDNSTEPTSVP